MGICLRLYVNTSRGTPSLRSMFGLLDLLFSCTNGRALGSFTQGTRAGAARQVSQAFSAFWAMGIRGCQMLLLLLTYRLAAKIVAFASS
eukprot:c24619_g5_i1 orf=69-335(+)